MVGLYLIDCLDIKREVRAISKSLAPSKFFLDDLCCKAKIFYPLRGNVSVKTLAK